jgi:SnoaL-like domain
MDSDRDAIIDTKIRYAWYGDAERYDEFDQIFTEDVECVYEGYGEPMRGRDTVIEFLRSASGTLEQTQHFFSNFVVEMRGADEAQLQHYMLAQHVNTGAEGGSTFLVGGMYTDLLRRTDDGWRISRLEHHTFWTSGNPAVLTHIAK